jgi:hypothetical protein
VGEVVNKSKSKGRRGVKIEAIGQIVDESKEAD